MNGFWGAETDAVRQQGEACASAARSAETLLTACAALIGGVEWIGPDADSFQARWGSGVRPRIEQIIETLRAGGEELNRHAEEQDDVSTDSPVGTGLPVPGQPGVPEVPIPTVPSLPGIPLPIPPSSEIPDCPVVRPEPEVFEIGFPPIMILPRPPLCPSFPPPTTESWPLPELSPLPMPRPDVHRI